MAHHAIIDPRPVDYREARLCAVYLAPDLLRELDASIDDTVRISTHRGRSVLGTVAAELNDASPNSIQIDRFTRQALKAYPHDEVDVEKVTLTETPEVALVPG